MKSAGEILRSARQEQGRSLAEIAEELCLTQRYLQAIEADDYKCLPGIFFYKSFAKQYAAILDVPENQIRSSLDAIPAADAEQPVPQQTPVSAPKPAGLERFLSMEKQPRFPHPIRVPDAIIQASNRYVSGGRIGFSVAVLAAVLLMCSGFYAWWNKPPVNRASSRSSVSALPLISLPSAALSREANESAQADTEGISQVVLDLSATEKTWLSITSEGKQIFSGVLEPSQTKTLTGLDAAKVKVGNAGGLEVKWNGKEIGPIGARGQVRTILFTPDNFQILNPPPATSSDETL